MSTRGLYGIRKNGIDKCTYNHCDSYPEYLGSEILNFCAKNSVERLSKLFDNIDMVIENTKPTEEQIDICKKSGYTDFRVSRQNENDWYCLLRNLQGDFKKYTECIDNNEKVFMIDNIDFIKASLFCEYAYIINLDEKVLEFYVGFQNTPQTNNRYGVLHDDNGYYPCKLAFVIPLDEINLRNINDLVEKMEKVLN